jgi:hypothetical protein
MAVLLILIFNLAGCANHFYRLKGDQLHIYLKNSDADSVKFAHSTDGFELHPAVKINSTTWRITLTEVSEFTYFYLVDGKVFLPACRFAEKDDFGSENCIFIPEM